MVEPSVLVVTPRVGERVRSYPLMVRVRARDGSRYIGSAKSRLQAAWTAAVVNLNPISHQLAAETT